ncbi:AP2-like ethylene-responsive transcription factor AIL6 [Prosopis cineraria]|uniref:AP2-like ethylene-responsive transcription factor AIL6 n=1 Tax=Prosopis cineraria TaxID=364024 RepID=UPI00240EA37E|nr:AP2-like ethylene-responsive transcription factor AIL6 [Prosopis cineraria]XP_054809382.1 AP2-like ethylene-responsive transcription factor AIL6 [Prosopis cineraria]XP_054809383.1 AP2-like ethylene-responsive transcription factor AIL6 [Prosopis cineraria]
MARATNWLSFSLSPMEMLRSTNSQYLQYDGASAAPHYFIDNFYANGWSNPKPQVLYSQVELDEGKESQAAQNMVESSFHPGFMEPQNHDQPVPKLEDFLGDSSSSIMRYSDSQTDTQDSSTLTHIYDQGSTYFSDQQDLKAIAGFQAFSTNSGSEVDDSASIGKTQAASGEFAAHSLESSRHELAFSSGTTTGTLSLGVTTPRCADQKTIVPVDSDSSKKIADTFGQRTSIYRGVTRHRWTGRYEAHLWDNSCRREGQARKGRQVYLGGYDKEDKAARAYDLAALKYWGPTATTNFPASNYAKEMEEMKHVTKQEFIASLRRKSSGFSRGASIYRGVTRHHQQGRWQARIGRVAGNKDLYLGTFATEEEAAEAYDIAAIKFRGANAVTNFEMSRYDVEAIMNSSLPIGGAAKRLKLSLESEQKATLNNNSQQIQSNSINFSPIQAVPSVPCGIPFDPAAAYYHHNLLNHFRPSNAGAAESAVSNPSATPFPAMPAPSEFFIWPPHQSY